MGGVVEGLAMAGGKGIEEDAKRKVFPAGSVE
jgi:hypothetical protein